MAGGGLDPVVEEEVFIATILGVLLIQWLLHLLKHSTQRNHQLAELVAMMYQELTVLVSMCGPLYSLLCRPCSTLSSVTGRRGIPAVGVGSGGRSSHLY